MSEPLLLMLDEPAAGLTGDERQALTEVLARIGRLGVALLVIEHDIAFVARVCRRVIVLAAGQVIADGTIEQVRANPAVVDAYLGTGSETPAPPARAVGVSLLEVEAVQVHRAGRVAVADVSITVGEREAVAIVGPNGAGKSTLLRAISGLSPASAGRIACQGRDITRLAPLAILRHGIVQVPEGRQLFPTLTVQQNIWLGGFLHGRRRREENVCRMFERFPRLAERRHQLAGSLSGGEQQVLAIARALASEPRMLLLDEPSVGLSPKMIGAVGDVVRQVQESGIAVLIVEQNITLACALAGRAYVLVTGRIAAHGPAAELLIPERLSARYLGGVEGVTA